ncbi:MAG: LptA/OstA family protein [Candidatus Aminicenantales bacterium]
MRRIQVKPHLAKIIRSVLAGFLLFIVLLVVGYFFIHWIREPRIRSEKKKEIAQQKVDVKEEIQYLEFKGEKGKTWISADRNYMGKDNRYHLEGHVKIIDFGRKGGREIQVSGDRALYDQEQSHFLLEGGIRVEQKDIVFQMDVLEYDREEGICRSDSGVSFTSARLSGFARKMSYSIRRNVMTLEDDLWVEMKPKLEYFETLQIKGNKVVYNTREGKGRIEGEVKLAQGESHGTADEIEFEQCFPEEDDIKVLLLKGNVRIFIKNNSPNPIPEKDALPEEGFLFFGGKEQEIEAEEVKIRPFLFTTQIHAIESKGNCSFKFVSSSGKVVLIRGEAVDFIFNRDRRLREFMVFEAAEISSFGKNAAEKRIVQGEVMKMEGLTNILRVQGKEGGRPARFLTSRSEVSAEEMALFLEKDDFEARTGVKAVFSPGKMENESVGFFSEKAPVFILAVDLRYSKEEKRFFFQDGVKMWQEKKLVEAREVAYNEETGEVNAEGEVRSYFPHKPDSDDTEDQIEISAGTMSYSPQENLITYKGNCFLKTRDFELRSQSLSVAPSQDRGQTNFVFAQKEVTLLRAGQEATGEEAQYDVEKEILVLSGNPVLVDKNRGVVRGGKLTFHLGDGRILVENRGQERSVTVIKS